MAMEEVDGLRQREDGCIAREDHSDGGDEDKKWLDIAENGFGDRGGGEEGHPEVDEDEILAQLRENAEQTFAGALGFPAHGVVRVVLESDTAEEERDDPR